jgi:alkyl hydroperoxide reductase subunit AhpF
MTVDLYLPTIGLLPNTEYVPKELLNEKGDVMVDQFLRVKSVSDVWAAGDIVDCQPGQFVYTGSFSSPLPLSLPPSSQSPKVKGGDTDPRKS